jgi:glycosyltransferase involved in cell wall biosynthesis
VPIKEYPFAVIRIPRNNLISKFFLYTKKLFYLSKEADVIFCQGPIASGLPSLIVKWLTGKKVLMKIVGDVAWERGRNKYGLNQTINEFQSKKHNLPIEFGKKLRNFIVKRVDQIITPSNYLKKIVSGWGTSPDKIKVIYNSFHIDITELTKEQAQKTIGLSGKIIMSIGRLASWKGFNTLVEIMSDLLKINQEFKLMIMGDGPEMDNLKKLVKKNSWKIK